MQKVLALVLVVVSFVHARNRTDMPSYWELLEIASVNEEYSLLLGHVGDMKYTLWLRNEYPDSFFQNICNSTGYSVIPANEVFDNIPYESLPCIYSEGTDDISVYNFYLCDAPVSDEYIVALKCFGSDIVPEYELIGASLYSLNNETEEIEYGREGLLVVNLRDKNADETYRTGTVCDDNFNDHAANLSCQYLGYKYAEAWGSDVPDRIYEFLSDLPILVDEVQCDAWTTSIMECEARFIDHDCSRSENLWLKCSEEDGEEGGTEEQGLELEFGGAKLNLNLNKIRTKWNF